MTRFRFPRRLELYRLEPLGDEPRFLDDGEAREMHAAGRRLEVIDERTPPSFVLSISKGNAGNLTFFSPERTPLRTATWQAEGDVIVCRRRRDVFYPEGDPRRRVPYHDVITVTQDLGTDGVLIVTRSSPLEDDAVWEVEGVDPDALRLPVPGFGEWDAIIEASAPPELTRFGWDAVEAADAWARRAASGGRERDPRDGGWRVPAGERGIVAALDAVLADGAAAPGVPVIDRADARILPLMIQADPARSSRDPREERARRRALSDAVATACEHYFGRDAAPPAFDLDHRGDDRRGAYAASLRAADAREVVWWTVGSHGIALVSSGDELSGDLSLALHVVPASWLRDDTSKPGGQRVDLRWSAADARAASAGPAASLTGTPQEEQDA